MLADPALVGRKIFHGSNLIAVHRRLTNKDEFAGTQALRYAENRSKSYALETEDEYKNIQKAKGLEKSLVKKELTIDIYEHYILEENTPASNITWKSIEEAQLKIIREAIHICYKKDSKLVSEYVTYIKNLRQENNPDEYVKSTTIILFPNEDAYERRMSRYRKWYQGKKELLASIKNLYSLYYTLSKEERPMTEEEISKTIEELIADKGEY
ncbi:6006_t:CDS:2 [Racocetra persica]|uniref:6006_t:CDS:1 n=1 Tax=Racocetra persica TaxID=160502 RepID=A0ACA9MEP0_9GLOM|nr:6006_t:CDS:2 [Racocetra persica]